MLKWKTKQRNKFVLKFQTIWTLRVLLAQSSNHEESGNEREGERKKDGEGQREEEREGDGEKAREVKYYFSIFGQSDWKNGDDIYWNRRWEKMDKFRVVVTDVEVKKAS